MDIYNKIEAFVPDLDCELVEALIENAKSFAIDYCNLAEYTDKLDNVVVNMVLEDYNRIDARGVVSRGISGMSESYNSDYSGQIYKALNKHRRLRML